MQHQTALSTLARLARQGDRNAAAEMRSELLVQMERIVRRALRVGGRGSNVMERTALVQARRITSNPRQPKFDSPDQLILLVVRRMVNDVMTNIAA